MVHPQEKETITYHQQENRTAQPLYGGTSRRDSLQAGCWGNDEVHLLGRSHAGGLDGLELA